MFAARRHFRTHDSIVIDLARLACDVEVFYHIYEYIYEYIRRTFPMFWEFSGEVFFLIFKKYKTPTFFKVASFHFNAFVAAFQASSWRHHESHPKWRCPIALTQTLLSSQYLHNDCSWGSPSAWVKLKDAGSKVWTVGRVKDSFDTHLCPHKTLLYSELTNFFRVPTIFCTSVSCDVFSLVGLGLKERAFTAFKLEQPRVVG